MTLNARLPVVGRRAIVVGSAPGLVLPEPDVHDFVIGANAGAALAREAGHRVHLLLTTSYLFRGKGRSQSEVESATLLSMYSWEDVWVDLKGGPLYKVTSSLNIYGSAIGISPKERSDVIRAATGSDFRVSTGLWGVCLACLAAADEIVVCGIDPSSDGHHGSDLSAPRDHVTPDSAALSALRDWRGLRVT